MCAPSLVQWLPDAEPTEGVVGEGHHFLLEFEGDRQVTQLALPCARLKASWTVLAYQTSVACARGACAE